MLTSLHKFKTLIFFFLATFFVSWAVWFTTIAEQTGILHFHIPQSLAFWFGLFITTYLVAWFTGGSRAVKDLAYRVIRWKTGIPPYLIAIFLPVAIAGVACAVTSILGSPPQIGKGLTLASIPITLLIELWLFLMTEETAWRGFALPRLQKLLSPLNAGLVLGVLWSIWHIPLFFIVDSFQSKLPFIGFAISTVAMSVFLTWLFNNSRGSVLICAIYHALTDISIAYFGIMGNLTAFWVTVGVQAAVGIWAGWSLYRSQAKLPAETIYADK